MTSGELKAYLALRYLFMLLHLRPLLLHQNKQAIKADFRLKL